MSAAVLREAANDMLDKHGPDHKRYRMWFTLASWLFAQANSAEKAEEYGQYDDRHFAAPLSIARAYLDAEK